MTVNTFPQNALAPEKVTASPKRVLIIEDDLYWQRRIQADVESNYDGIDFQVVDSGEKAVEAFGQTQGFDVIIADQKLKGLKTGYELWKKNAPQMKDACFILISGNQIDDFSEVTHELERPYFMMKPFRSESLADLIASVWHKRMQELARNKTKFSVGALILAASLLTALTFASPRFQSVPSEIQIVPVENILSSPVTVDHQRQVADSAITPKVKKHVQHVLKMADGLFKDRL